MQERSPAKTATMRGVASGGQHEHIRRVQPEVGDRAKISEMDFRCEPELFGSGPWRRLEFGAFEESEVRGSRRF